ncbi:MAG: MFS transporter [Proteobacteria bacterium]|nr:MFS transporter [Pseudomonadota bacterium]
MVNTVTPEARPYVIASILVATFMAAIEMTIVATAMPSIVSQIGGFTYYAWVFSAFLLAQSTTTVIYGKLSDLFGRKPTLIVGISLLLLGSLLCGFAWSMPSLVAFRALQGLGAGAITPITATIIGDLYKLEKRGRVQGMMAGVWAISGVLGPLAGGLIVDHLSWAWIFWINLPIGALAILGLALFLHEKVEVHRARIDYLGTLLFCVSIGSLLFLLSEGDVQLWIQLALGAAFVASGTLFLLHERRAPEPIVSIELWLRRLIATSNIATLLAGMMLLGLTTVLPIYLQGVLGRSALVAGSTLSTLVIGWPLAVMFSGRLYRAFGIRPTLLTGSILLPLGAVFLLFLGPQSTPLVAGIGLFVMGFGMGLVSMTSIALVQDSVEWSMRGSATASLIFARSLGSTIGATAAGTLLNMGIAHYGNGALAARLRELLNQPAGLSHLADNPLVRYVFDHALRWSFVGVAVLSVLTSLAVWLIPVAGRPVSEAEPAVARVGT